MRRFIDTNVLLYLVSGSAEDSAKSVAAEEILTEKDLALSVEVLQEFCFQVTRPSRPDRLSPEEALGLIESWVLRFPVQEMTMDIVRTAIGTASRYGISYWDAAIIEAARTLTCGEVLSEDLNDGQNYGGVRVRNPFRTSRRKR